MVHISEDIKRKVLLITEDGATAEFYKIFLAPNYECIAVANDEEAINLLKTSQTKKDTHIDFLVAKISQSINQNTIFQNVQSAHPDLPRVVIAKKADYEAARRAIKNGALAYIEEGESIEELVNHELKPLLQRNISFNRSVSREIHTGTTNILFADLEMRLESEPHVIHSLDNGDCFDVYYATSESEVLRSLRQRRTDIVLVNRSRGDNFNHRMLRTIKNTYKFTPIVHFISPNCEANDMNMLNGFVDDFLPMNISEYCFFDEILRLERIRNKMITNILSTDSTSEIFPAGKPGIILVNGQRATAKSTSVCGVTCALPFAERIITGVGRAPRPGEVDGVDHYFLDDGYLKQNEGNRELFDFYYVHQDGYSVVIPYGKIQRYFQRGCTVFIVLTNIEAQNKFLEEFDSKTYNIKKLLVMPHNPKEVYQRSKKRDLVPQTRKRAFDDYRYFDRHRFLFDNCFTNENYHRRDRTLPHLLGTEFNIASLIRQMSDFALFNSRYSFGF